MANVLVTGGAGYVGSVCCAELLRAGHSVVVVDDLSTGFRQAVPRGTPLHQSDIADPRAMRFLLSENKFDAVFHFAAKALVPESVSNPGVFFQQNVAGGISFLEAVRAAGVKKFVFSSSAAVYGAPQTVPIDEEHAKEPTNSYGETKLMLERALEWYASAYHWSVVALRYFNAAGATEAAGERHQPETHIIPLLLQAAAGERDFFTLYGDDYSTPDGTCVRDYVHVSDIAAAHLLALDAMKTWGMTAYNIGCGQGYSVREVISAVEDVTGKRIPLHFAPRRAGDPAALCANPAKLKRELGWEPSHSQLATIIESAWTWKLLHPRATRLPKAEPSQRTSDFAAPKL
jgi:UDP-glucose 4-epimerase